MYEPFSRCDCENPYVYEQKKMLMAKEAPKKIQHYKQDGEQLPFVIDSVTTLHCTKCHKERYQIQEMN